MMNERDNREVHVASNYSVANNNSVGGKLSDSMESFSISACLLHAYFPGGRSFWQNGRVHFSPTNKNGCDIRTSKLF